MRRILNRLLGYDIPVKCINCNFKTVMRVPRGTTIKDYLKGNKTRCLNCGCIARIILTESSFWSKTERSTTIPLQETTTPSSDNIEKPKEEAMK